MSNGRDRVDESSTPQQVVPGSIRSSTPQQVDTPSIEPGTSSTPQNIGDQGGDPPPADD
jgi:hypothetical protein